MQQLKMSAKKKAIRNRQCSLQQPPSRKRKAQMLEVNQAVEMNDKLGTSVRTARVQAFNLDLQSGSQYVNSGQSCLIKSDI